MKYIFCSLALILFIVSCKKQEGYVIDGRIKGLENSSIVIRSTQELSLHWDTIQTDKDGRFTFKSTSDSLNPVIIYMKKGEVWATVWAQNDNKINLSGNVAYPELIIAKGGKTNDLLAKFKEKNKKLLIEKWDLQLKHSSLLGGTDSLHTDFDGTEYSSKIVNLNQQLKNEVEDFIRQNPTSVASLVLIQDYLIDFEDPESVREYLSLISGEALENQLFRKLDKLNKQLLQVTVGYEAPDFSVIDTRKDTLCLDTFKDRYLLLAFAASWCEMCKQENLELAKLRSTFKEDQLGMLTISLDVNSNDWKEMAEEDKITWLQVIDNREWGSEMVSRYNVTSVPFNILIDKERKIAARGLTTDSLTIILKNKLKIEKPGKN